jgi:hypothetical protein
VAAPGDLRRRTRAAIDHPAELVGERALVEAVAGARGLGLGVGGGEPRETLHLRDLERGARDLESGESCLG